MRLIVVVSLILVSCDDPFNFFNSSGKTAQGSKALVVEIPIQGSISTTGIQWVTLDGADGQISALDISKYQTVDSVIFKASLRSASEENKCLAELYNLTDGTPVPSSTLYSFVRYTLHTVRSNDLRFSLPNKNVSLGVRIRSERVSNYVEARNFSVLVYYH